MSSPRQQPLRPQCQYQHHDEECHGDRISGYVDRAKLLARPMMSAPSAAPGIEPMPPTMTTTNEASRKRVSSPEEIDWKVPPTTPAMPAMPAPSAKTRTKTS